MKLAGALMALASVATVVAFVLAVTRTKDDLVGTMRDCARRGQATLVHGPANLGAARQEIDAGTVRRVRRVRRGADTVLLMTGQHFRLLVLAGKGSPSLAGDLPRRVYERADAFPVVALETDPVRGVLLGCVALAGRG